MSEQGRLHCYCFCSEVERAYIDQGNRRLGFRLGHLEPDMHEYDVKLMELSLSTFDCPE